MMRMQRTLFTLSVAGVVLSILAGMAQSQDQETYTISGSVNMAGVVMKGLPGAPLTDGNGVYSAAVSSGWKGTVTPTKTGFTFDPPAKTYSSVASNYTNENYRWQVLRFTISGNAGVEGARLLGLPGQPVSGEGGLYSVEVPYGWAGIITPTKERYSFDPMQRTYPPVKKSHVGADFEAKMLTYRIAGEVGLAGVSMQGLPGEPITDTRGYYTATVPYGWTGTVSPMKRGCRFEPADRSYTSVKAHQQDHDYKVVGLQVATPPSYGGGRSEVLVIPTSEVDAEQVAQIEEDMQVMLEILRDRLSESRMDLGGLIDYGDFFGGQSGEALYLESYGVVFVMTVDFPLSFPSEQPSEGEPEREVDPVWQRARQKLRSPSIKYRYGAGRRSAAAEGISLEQFQEELIKALRHAANVRHIASSDRIILTVIGQDEGGVYGYRGSRGAYGGGYGGGSRSVSRGSFGRGGGSTYTHSEVYTSGSGTSRTPTSDGYGNVKRDALGRVIYEARPTRAVPTVLTMQTTKADVEAYATGEIDVEQFRSRVKIFSY